FMALSSHLCRCLAELTPSKEEYSKIWHFPERLLPPQRRLELPGGSHRHSPARRHRPRQHDLGQHAAGGSDYPRSQSTFPQSRKILEGVPDGEQIVGLNTAQAYHFDVARLITPG